MVATKLPAERKRLCAYLPGRPGRCQGNLIRDIRIMQYINISHPEQKVTFPQAVVTGLGKGQGLFFPEQLKPLGDIPGLLELDFVSIPALNPHKIWMMVISYGILLVSSK